MRLRLLAIKELILKCHVTEVCQTLLIAFSVSGLPFLKFLATPLYVVMYHFYA